MELGSVLAVLVGIVLVVILLKLIGKVVSVALTVIGIIAVVWLAVAGLRFLDVQNLEENFAGSNNLFVLSDGGSAITGFATQEDSAPDLEKVKAAVETGDDAALESYYKVVTIEISSLPEKTALLIDATDGADRAALFRDYVLSNFVEPEDRVSRLIEAEKQGALSVSKDTLAFRQGLKEVVSP
jgi:hypothetical protein